MRKIITFTAALILMGVGIWATKTTPHVEASTEVTVYPLQLMTNAKNLPESHYDDYTFVFN
jgi:hypothetical membrane protein